MVAKSRNIYQYWHHSSLAGKIDSSCRTNLDNIWRKAADAYARTTWPGWVNHGTQHILRVLRNLDSLIPDYVHKRINETDAFILLAGTFLHDIGMVDEKNRSPTLVEVSYIRQTHGLKGAQIARKDFGDFLQPEGQILHPVCEIIANHHGEFNPSQLISPADFRAYALWVRLADELDFGPGRAPSWLLDYVQPNGEQFQHWIQHNALHEPLVDLDLFRVQVTGTVESKAFVQKLRAEFEGAERQDIQKSFLHLGSQNQSCNKTFIIWDCTTVKTLPGDDSKEIDARPAIFPDEQFFLGGRYLYNLGRYEIARKCFEDGLRRGTGRWSDMPAFPYFYHYLKTLNGLGEHREALKIADEYKKADFPREIKAAIAISDGIAHWKLNELEPAFEEFETSGSLYNELGKQNVTHKINEADAWVLLAIAHIEKARSIRGEIQEELKIIKQSLRRAENLFTEFRESKPKVPESHYMGRYWGAKAFLCLIQIEPTKNRKAKVWAEALRFADLAHGGDALVSRNPFGAMCGKYCAGAVSFHKYDKCEEKSDKQRSLKNSAKIINEILKMYNDLFGSGKRIPRLWPKICKLSMLVRKSLPRGERKELPHFSESWKLADGIQIYTPLH